MGDVIEIPMMGDPDGPGWRLHRYELAAAPLDEPTRFVIVGRPTGMRFIGADLSQLELLCDMATRATLRAIGV